MASGCDYVVVCVRVVGNVHVYVLCVRVYVRLCAHIDTHVSGCAFAKVFVRELVCVCARVCALRCVPSPLTVCVCARCSARAVPQPEHQTRGTVAVVSLNFPCRATNNIASQRSAFESRLGIQHRMNNLCRGDAAHHWTKMVYLDVHMSIHEQRGYACV